MKLSNVLLEEALFNSHVKTLYSLTESDLKTLDKDLTSEELNALMESFQEDPELMLEFLGTIAGLGGKAAKYMSSKLASVGDKANNFSKKRAQKAEQHKTRKAHTKAVKAYGKSLKSGNKEGRGVALKAMIDARNSSRKARGKSELKGKPIGKQYKNIYKRIGECILKEASGGFTTFSNPDNEDNDVSYRKLSKKRQAQLRKAGRSKKK